MNQTMNDLALLAIGIGFGLALSLVAIMTYVLWTSARKMQHDIGVFIQTVPALRDQIASALDKLRGEVSVGLAKMDAERLYSASINLQRLVKSLGMQVDTMQKAVFAQPPSPAIDWTPPGTGLDTEAEDDARMLADRARWRQETSQPAYQPVGYPAGYPPAADPLANLSEEDKSRRVLEYFERQRAARAGYPYPASQPDSTPPTAGSGAYASLLDEANRQPVLTPLPPDFSGMEPEEGVDLIAKGELE